MNENLMLFVDCCLNGGLTMDLCESTDKGLTKFRGKFQEAEAVNKNKRVYPFNILDMNLKGLMPALEGRGLIGELDHPTDSIVHFEKASHLVTKLWWEGNNLMGEGEILNTPSGRILKALINDGVRVGISSRGVGNGKMDENGIFVIGESYKLITFDAVADPSTNFAYQKKVTAGKQEAYIPAFSQEINKNVVKNENHSIHKCNKDLLIACLDGIVKQQTSTIKARLV